MGTTVGDLLSLQNGSFRTVKIYNRKEIFSGSVKKPWNYILSTMW